MRLGAHFNFVSGPLNRHPLTRKAVEQAQKADHVIGDYTILGGITSDLPMYCDPAYDCTVAVLTKTEPSTKQPISPISRFYHFDPTNADNQSGVFSGFAEAIDRFFDWNKPEESKQLIFIGGQNRGRYAKKSRSMYARLRTATQLVNNGKGFKGSISSLWGKPEDWGCDG